MFFDHTPWGSWLFGNRLTILAYHSISDDFQDELSISPAVFFEQMAWIKNRSFNVIPLDQALEKLNDKSDLRRHLVITFDDGYSTILKNAIPTLEKFQYPATIFMVTGKAGQLSDWHHLSPSRHLLSRDDLLSLHKEGYTIGSHSHHHVDLTLLQPAELEEELLTSKRYLENELRIKKIFFSYPYGNFGEREQQALLQYQICCACKISKWQNVGYDTNILELNRFEIHRRHTLKQFATICSSRFRWPLILSALEKSIQRAKNKILSVKS